MQIQSAFEQAGIVFLDSDASGGIGARLEKELQRGFYEGKQKHLRDILRSYRLPVLVY
jgi:hypothetical protein